MRVACFIFTFRRGGNIFKHCAIFCKDDLFSDHTLRKILLLDNNNDAKPVVAAAIARGYKSRVQLLPSAVVGLADSG